MVGRRRNTRRSSVGQLLLAALMIAISLVMLYPIYNQLVISLTGPEFIAQADGSTIIPRGFTLQTYAGVLSIPKVYRGLFNSFFITFAGLLVNVTLTSMGAYVLTKRDLLGRNIFMSLIVITMIFEGGLIPDYFLMKNLGLLNS
ncbi:MAG: carbohydrate ABC transporter permease, partial [Spirochaetia bacterium]|nr:carbohydrate ABC transporter permease [Spirochaetia bacterium]